MRGLSQEVDWASSPSFRLTAFSPSFLTFLKRPLIIRLQTTQMEVGVGIRMKNVLPRACQPSGCKAVYPESVRGNTGLAFSAAE